MADAFPVDPSAPTPAPALDDGVKTLERAVVMRLVTNLIALIVGAAVAVVSGWLGVKAPDAITIPVTVQAAPAVAPVVDGEGGGAFEARPRLLGLRSRIHAEIDRRATLDTADPLHLDREKASDTHAFVGRLGDGHLLDLIVKYGPTIIKIVMAILSLMAVI